ncbi:MAG TPA: sulfatase-like hydrolase/transferase [Casimicrobiaceae bacterium]|nr:sulfatase-like hydrolase/transferase [Casimicrobiaceae bacterium]
MRRADDMNERYNILFITSDQQRGDCYGFEGCKVKTPHLDEMARQGTRFSACITPNLVCQPSRSSILTGLLPLTHGVADNGIDLPPEIAQRGFAGTLSAHGYHTALIGKAHFTTSHTFEPTGTPECRESSAQHGPDWNGPYMGFDHVELMLEGHNCFPPMEPPRGHHYERWYHADGRGAERTALYHKQLPPLTDATQTWNSALPLAWHNSTWIGNRTIDYLREHRTEPFCVWASFPDPHHPFDAPEPWCRLHDPDDVDVPAHRTLDLERRPWWHRASLEGVPQMANARLRAFREESSRTPVQTEAQLRHIIANYYGMISLIDHQVGRMMIALRDLGLDQNTIVIYSTDHGDWLGDHGLILKGPMAYEGLLRVGLIVQGPGVPAHQVVHEPVSTIDLPQTFCDYAGTALAQPNHSRSLRPLIEGRSDPRDFAYSEWDLRASRCGVDLALRTVRTQRHKLTLELNSGAGELYDLVNDPLEMDNRFDDDGYAKVRRELTDMVRTRPDDVLEPALPQVGMA